MRKRASEQKLMTDGCRMSADEGVDFFVEWKNMSGRSAQPRISQCVVNRHERTRNTSLEIFLEAVVFVSVSGGLGEGRERGKERKSERRRRRHRRARLSRDKDRPGEISWLNSLLIKGFGGV